MNRKLGFSILVLVVALFCLPLLLDIIGCATVNNTTTTTTSSGTTTTVPIIHGGPTIVTSNVGVNTTWSLSGSPYIISAEVHVSSGVVLTVEAGVAVKFMSPRSLTVDGALDARGTAGAPVYFTSVNDNSYASTSYGTGRPAKGDWGAIQVYDTYGNQPITRLNYAVVRYAGAGASDKANISVYGNDTAVTNTTIASSDGVGILVKSGSNMAITNNTIETCDWPIEWRENNANVTLSGNTILGNTHNGIKLGWTEVAPHTRMTLVSIGTQAAYVIPNNNAPTCRQFAVRSGAKLTLSPGVILKLDQNVEVNIGSLTERATLEAIGTAGNPIYITSYYDGTVGGNTANSSIDPTANNYQYSWVTLYLWGTSDLQYCVVGVGGNQNGVSAAGGYGTLLDISSPSTVSNCIFGYGYKHAIVLDRFNGRNDDLGRTLTDMNNDKAAMSVNNDFTTVGNFGSSEVIRIL